MRVLFGSFYVSESLQTTFLGGPSDFRFVWCRCLVHFCSFQCKGQTVRSTGEAFDRPYAPGLGSDRARVGMPR